jgi:alkanesulfonate monooxygenase SsuD/methylene tetrahydromethanopterin reductase-like flavin-dependent oxidoreductase (luciferase family)
VARVSAPDLAAAHAARQRVREAVAAAGRDPDEVAVLLDVETLLADSVDQAKATLAQLNTWVDEPPAPTAALAGTAAGLAEFVEDAVRGGAADGVTLLPLALPSGLHRIAAELVPLLVERGVRPGAAGQPRTLRERFGLPRPANYFTEVRA